MDDIDLQRIVEIEYNITIVKGELLNTGLINVTWKLICQSNECYILQQINTDVFNNPFIIDNNMKKLQSKKKKKKKKKRKWKMRNYQKMLVSIIDYYFQRKTELQIKMCINAY